MYEFTSSYSKLAVVRPCKTIGDRWLEVQLNIRQHFSNQVNLDNLRFTVCFRLEDIFGPVCPVVYDCHVKIVRWRFGFGRSALEAADAIINGPKAFPFTYQDPSLSKTCSNFSTFGY